MLLLSHTTDANDGHFFLSGKERVFLKQILRGFPVGYRPGTTTIGHRKVSSISGLQKLCMFTDFARHLWRDNPANFSDMCIFRVNKGP